MNPLFLGYLLKDPPRRSPKCLSQLGGAPTFGGISKLLFQNSITYVLVNQSLIWKHNSPCYHVLKGNYPNKFLSRSKTSAFGSTIGCGAKNPVGGGGLLAHDRETIVPIWEFSN